MRKFAMFLATVALGLVASGCSNDTPAENEVEKQAEAIDDAYEADARLEEALDEGSPTEEAADAHADALREEGDRVRQDLKKQADELGRDTRQMEKEAREAAE